MSRNVPTYSALVRGVGLRLRSGQRCVTAGKLSVNLFCIITYTKALFFSATLALSRANSDKQRYIQLGSNDMMIIPPPNICSPLLKSCLKLNFFFSVLSYLFVSIVATHFSTGRISFAQAH